jgi:hypothetical protein
MYDLTSGFGAFGIGAALTLKPIIKTITDRKCL